MEESSYKLNKTISSQPSSSSSSSGSTGRYDAVWSCVIPYIHDPRDRDAFSLVCKSWYQLDAQTRKHVTIALCYSTTPERLRQRFPLLESLKLKGKPRAAMFNLIIENWGGYVTPWVREVCQNFKRLRSLHFRRMIVLDSDLKLLARERGSVLQVLKVDKCSGFSTDGLLHVGRWCRQLRVLFLEESMITEKDGQWLHELASNNTVLESLNFYMTDLSKVSFEDLELMARKCPSLTSVKISDIEILHLIGLFRNATALKEFYGGSFNEQPHGGQHQLYATIPFPQQLCSLGLTYMGNQEMPIIFPFASHLRKLDLLYAFLGTEDHCDLIERCPNLEILEARNVIGDQGLESLARSCKGLKRLRIERGADEQGLEDEGGAVSQIGLIALAEGCLELEYLAVYVSDITNEALEHIGTHLSNISDFRLVLLDREERITDLPLDNGVRALLRGCKKLRRFALYLRPGGLTDLGMSYIGLHSRNIIWMLLGYVGESDNGLLEFSKGCPSLQKLEMRGCCFSERALATAVTQLTSLRYFWVQGYRASPSGHNLLAMRRPFWNIELIPAREVDVQLPAQVGVAGPLAVTVVDPAQILAYYSLAGPRMDCPPNVIQLDPLP
uniref:Coronatine-insensitive protein 1 n=1 Tax=Aquilaria sinensis TaxID=210372 RepID=A0A0R5NEC3_9ROSI|nr:coronatine-insensitive protein 1 [Aquilaria sinensis]